MRGRRPTTTDPPAGPIPPHDERAERVVLCGLMTDFPAAFPAVCAAGLVGGDFYLWPNQTAFRGLVECHAAGDPADALALYRRLTQTREAADFGNLARWLGETLEADPTHGQPFDGPWDRPVVEWAGEAAERVHWLAVRRLACHRARELFRDAMDGALLPGDERLAAVGAV